MQTFKPAVRSHLPPWALPGTRSVLDQPAPAALDIAGAHEYKLALATERAQDPTFCILWQALVAASDSPQKIYQSPAFFKFAQDARQPGERLELLTVTRASDGALVGVVPMRISKQDLNFKFGPVLLHNAKLEMINLLGSIPAAPPGTAMADQLASAMLALFPDVKAVMMPSLPQDSAHWNDLSEIPAAGGCLSTAQMGPWRECHRLPLPERFEQYLDKFSAKKRYNLNRQIRQLTEQVGPLELERVERPEQVAGMMRSLEVLVPPAHLKLLSSETTFKALAAKHLLLCHVLRAGDQVLAAMLGTQASGTLHVHNIFVDKKYLALSVGTSAMHLAIKDLVEMGGLDAIDFGYGSPNNDFRSSHVRETRAQVLLYDNTKSISLLFFMHHHFTAVTEGIIGAVKAARKRLQTRRTGLA
jgi:CelD/BcsL family acetyltransferase involved in cellulose biosynthesis